MESNSERKGEASEAMRAFRRELFTQMAEVQEEQARTSADPKDREEHERLAQASRKSSSRLGVICSLAFLEAEVSTPAYLASNSLISRRNSRPFLSRLLA